MGAAVTGFKIKLLKVIAANYNRLPPSPAKKAMLKSGRIISDLG